MSVCEEAASPSVSARRAGGRFLTQPRRGVRNVATGAQPVEVVGTRALPRRGKGAATRSCPSSAPPGQVNARCAPRVPLRSTRGYSPWPLRGRQYALRSTRGYGPWPLRGRQCALRSTRGYSPWPLRGRQYATISPNNAMPRIYSTQRPRSRRVRNWTERHERGRWTTDFV
jgi:hypothetical protein